MAQGFIYGAYLALMYDCAVAHLPRVMLEAIEWKKAKKLLSCLASKKRKRENIQAPAFRMAVISARAIRNGEVG